MFGRYRKTLYLCPSLEQKQNRTTPKTFNRVGDNKLM